MMRSDAGVVDPNCVKCTDRVITHQRMWWEVIVAACTCTGCTIIHSLVKSRLRWTTDHNLIYFTLHSLLNAYVCQSVYPHVLQTLDTGRFVSSASGLATGQYRCVSVICGFHLYHIVTQSTRLSLSDWLHHLISVGASAYLLVKCDHAIGCATLFFLCGLPGLVDYLVLIGQKVGWVPRLTQKHVSSLVHITVRVPGVLWCCFLAYQIGLEHPNRVYFFVTCVLSATNGLYFGYDAVCSYGKALASTS